MKSYDLYTKRELVERLIILENDLLRLKAYLRHLLHIGQIKEWGNEDVSDLVMEDHERKLKELANGK